MSDPNTVLKKLLAEGMSADEILAKLKQQETRNERSQSLFITGFRITGIRIHPAASNRKYSGKLSCSIKACPAHRKPR